MAGDVFGNLIGTTLFGIKKSKKQIKNERDILKGKDRITEKADVKNSLKSSLALSKSQMKARKKDAAFYHWKKNRAHSITL